MSRRFLNVSVAVLLLLLTCGLLLPFVSKVHGPALRMTCTNNLKQIALASYNYQDAHGVFPRATIHTQGLQPERRLSFFVALLPYLEQDALAKAIDADKAWDADENLGPRSGLVKMLLCPAEDRQKLPQGLTHYVGIAGIGKDAAGLAEGDVRAGFFGHSRTLSLQRDTRGKVVGVEGVKDGDANTAMLIETAWEIGPWIAGGFPTVRGIDPADAPHVGLGRAFGGLHVVEKNVLSNPVSGAQFAFVDGSVRFIRDTVSPDVLEALATIAGGETVPLPDF